MSIIKNTTNFVVGNMAGFLSATASVTVVRPYTSAVRTIVGSFAQKSPEKDEFLRFLDAKEKTIPSAIKFSYNKFGAIKSGKFWTQNVGSFFSKLLGKK